MNPVPFSKMHGLGNDFIIINNINQTLPIKKLNIPELANRYIGIGFDQLLILEPSQKADFFCRIYNADGSEAEQCGNGLRCVARFIIENKLHASLKNKLTLETMAGLFSVSIPDYEHISIDLGNPDIQSTLTSIRPINQDILLNMTCLSLGNPHAVIKIDSLTDAMIDHIGPGLTTHTQFIQGANIGFMEVINPTHVRLRTFERGSGETLACGSNACAAAITGILNGWLTNKVEIEFKYGSLWIEWAGEGQPVRMTGPASLVFTGELWV